MHTHRLIVLIFFLSSFLTKISAQHRKVETWYDNQKHFIKESYYTLKNNPQIFDSLYISYYQNSKIKSKGLYNKNKLEGLWEYFYENGSLKIKGQFKDNIALGKWECYYENGELNMEGMIEKGQREKEWKFYYENGKVKTVGEYKRNQKEGLWRYFYEDGNYKAQADFVNDKGTYLEVYSSGKVKSEGDIVAGKSNGYWKYYYENGQLKAAGIEMDGLKEGHWKYYFKNGKIASEGDYIEGQENGPWKYYHENGNLNSEGIVREGQKDGYWKLYYADGTFKAEGKFKEGDGNYKEYYESGKLKIEGFLKKGKNEGEWKYYYENGNVEGNCFFIDGKGEYIGYYESGKLKMQGIIDDGKKVGIWKLYNEQGDLAGYYKTYYENEVPVFVPLEEEIVIDSVKADSIKPIVKPELKLPKKRSRHYVKKIHEYKDFIVSIHPLGILRNQIPLSIEYYIQERLGYEINFSYHKYPFFKSASSLPLNAGYKRGFSTYIRQKLYSKDMDNGMFYWAQELRFTSLDYYVNYQDVSNVVLLQSSESLYEFSVLFGDRFLRDPKKKGWTVDLFGGMGVGYRSTSKNFPSDPVKDALFLGLKKSKITIPVRLGVSVGYLF